MPIACPTTLRMSCGMGATPASSLMWCPAAKPTPRPSALHSSAKLPTHRSVSSAEANLTNVGHPTGASNPLLSMALSKLQGGARLLDPSCRVHLLEHVQGTFNQRDTLRCLVALSKATVGKQGLGQFGRALDLL